MVDEFMNIEFTEEELRNIIFPENIVTCRSCRKPRINKRLSVDNFSQEHQDRICTVGRYHGPHNQYIQQINAQNNAQINNVQNNIQNIAPINAQNNIQDNIPNIVPDNAQNEIQNAEDIHVDPNIVPMIPQRVNENVHDNHSIVQNYVTQNEFNNFKDSVNNQFQLVKEQLQQINKGIEDLKGEMKNDFKAINERVNNIENRIGIRGEEEDKKEEEEE
jgi:hypothetical protein